MNFDIVQSFRDHGWLKETEQKLDRKMRFAVGKAREVSWMPYTTENGRWKETRIGWWTNGFWPASMWQMYRMTGAELYREEALRAENMLDEALRNFKNLSHDTGFMWLIHSGVRYALEKNPESFDRTLFAAEMLAARFNPNGFIRAWNGEGREGWAIVNCMMNLPLLYWASEETGDPRFRLIAMAHADTTLRIPGESRRPGVSVRFQLEPRTELGAVRFCPVLPAYRRAALSGSLKAGRGLFHQRNHGRLDSPLRLPPAGGACAEGQRGRQYRRLRPAGAGRSAAGNGGKGLFRGRCPDSAGAGSLGRELGSG